MFMVDHGARAVTEQDVIALEVPEPKNQHYPIPHEYLINTVRDIFGSMFPEFELVKEQYALGLYNRETKIPSQMFGLFTYDTGDPRFGLAIGFRNSYLSSIACGIVGGANPFVCSNLCFSGDSFTMSRKNTRNAMQDLYDMVLNNAYNMLDDYRGMVRNFEVLETIEVSQDEGYEILGLMQAHKVIKLRPYVAAVEAWRKPPQEDWAPRNALSLYNAVTEGTKKTKVSDVVEDLSKPHKFFKEKFHVDYLSK